MKTRVLAVAVPLAWIRYLPLSFAVLAIITVPGCGQEDFKFSREMKVFALTYHQMAQGEGKLSVDDGGGAKIDWNRRAGPSKLEEMAASEPDFPELAKRIRNGAFVVVWRGKLRPTAEDNHSFFLGHEAGIEKSGGWVLGADGEPEKMSAADFKKLSPLPND